MSDHSEMKQYIEQRLRRGLDTPELDGAEVLALINDLERVKALNHQKFGDAIRKNAEVDLLRKDHERINFIENNWFYAAGVNQQEFCFKETWQTPGQDLREAIDLAIAKEQQQ